VTIQGRFIGGVPYFAVHLLTTHFHGLVWLVADTGASRTVLLDRDFRRLGIPKSALSPAPGAIVGVGGSVLSCLLVGIEITLAGDTGDVVLVQDIWVAQHDLQRLAPEEARRILRLPSVMGRDMINQFRFTCDYQGGIVELMGP
jgi:hypothetical protein